MSIDHLANQDFERAVLRAFWRKVLSFLTGKNNQLLPFDEVRERLPIRGQHYKGLQEVSIDKIVGSMGRYHDFDRAFFPTQTRTKNRWVSIDKAHISQVNLPPVDLFKIGDIYFVKDGNHRVSVARERGQEFIDAFVTQIDIPVVLTPETRIDELDMKRDYAEFLLKTRLLDLRPDANLETTVPGVYERLLEHIAVHRWYLGEQQGAEVSYENAVLSWFDRVYLPVVELIREQGILKEFHGSSEADLYLWLLEYQAYLRLAMQEEFSEKKDAKAEAAKELVKDYPQPAVKKLVNLLNKTVWVSELLLKQEQILFLEETQLASLRPDVHIETTIPGQYDALREHIAVHRWYLGEQRQSEVPYLEAVGSWYDHVYLPLVEIIRGQRILAEFPERTETDFYLWVIQHQARLQASYEAEIPVQQAAEKLAEDLEKKAAKETKKHKKADGNLDDRSGA